MKNRDFFILGAIILAGAVAVELYSNYANPYLEYTPGAFTSLLTNTPQRFNYYKDGALIGTYTYTLTSETRGSQTLYTLMSTSNGTYEGNLLNVNATHRFFGAANHAEYTVDSHVADVTSHLECVFLAGKVGIVFTQDDKSQSISVTPGTNAIIIDNNDPAHWELLMKSATFEPGKKYKVNAILPQSGSAVALEFGVDTAHQYVNIGGTSYDCVVAREPNFEITLYFYQGNLIKYENKADGILIVKQMS
jgi:hypothetical protein